MWALKGLWSSINRGCQLKQVEKLIDSLTSVEAMKGLQREDKVKLAYVIELFRNNKERFSKEMKDSLIAIAAGWTIADVGFSQSIKYGLGYVGLRNIMGKK